ncbi:hypothetical protein BDY24DRAFT_445211 [Mrakia frigida]|uniref:uncharacterized protein n=1 Tax=Mrakia frigida TaxID=29902 RepID=UPI003FCC0BD8
MLNSILDQETGPWLSNTTRELEKQSESTRSIRRVEGLSVESEDEGVDDDGDWATFGSFMGASEDKFDPYPSFSATPIHQQSFSPLLSSPTWSSTSGGSSHRPSSSHASWSSSATSSAYLSFTSLDSTFSPTPPTVENIPFSPYTQTSPTSDIFPSEDPFELSSLLDFGRVEEAGGFGEPALTDSKTKEVGKLEGLEDVDMGNPPRGTETKMDSPSTTRPPFPPPLPTAPSVPLPPVFAPPLTLDHLNPYYELGRYHHVHTKSSSSTSSSSSTLVLLNPPSPISTTTTTTKKSRSLPLPKPKPYSPSSSSSSTFQARPRSSSFGVMPSFVEWPSSSFGMGREREKEEDFGTALARLRREKGPFKIELPKLSWVGEGGQQG